MTPMTTVPNHRTTLQDLLSQRNQYPERHAAIDAEIQRHFSQKLAVLVLDMSGFSRLTANHGIIHFLAMVHKMEQAATPAVTGNGGHVVKQEADNLFAVYPTPQMALESALDIRRAMAAMNTVLPEYLAIRVCIGIGYGDTLYLEDQDMFDHEVNLACKLGEDLAKADEILLTAAAHAELPEDDYEFTSEMFEISGLSLKSWRYQGRLFSKTISARAV